MTLTSLSVYILIFKIFSEYKTLINIDQQEIRCVLFDPGQLSLKMKKHQ